MKNNTLHYGLTGNIGSGKSTVAALLAVLGVPVYYADDRAKAILTEEAAVKQAVTELLGAEAYREDGSLNKTWIAGKVFHDKSLLTAYNHIIHPAVRADAQNWQTAQSNAPYTIREAALLFEAGSYRELDGIICVTAPEALRLSRVMNRDGVTEAQVVARMAHQWPEAEKEVLSQFVIVNDGQQPLIPQVWRIHHALLQLYSLGSK